MHPDKEESEIIEEMAEILDEQVVEEEDALELTLTSEHN